MTDNPTDLDTYIAKRLFTAFRTVVVQTTRNEAFPDWKDLPGTSREPWLAVARDAVTVVEELAEALSDEVPTQYSVSGDMPPEESLFSTMKVRTNPDDFIASFVTKGDRVYLRRTTIASSDICDAQRRFVFGNFPEERGVLYFIDHNPEANWAHNCTYVLRFEP
jgi:hypothetical protein